MKLLRSIRGGAPLKVGVLGLGKRDPQEKKKVQKHGKAQAGYHPVIILKIRQSASPPLTASRGLLFQRR
jgi:hypothetical protein